MSVVIRNMLKSPPEGWIADSISTHGKSIIMTLKRWLSSRRELKRVISRGEIDLAHIHVTHSISWWRKRGLMRICRKGGVPIVIQIHSGKFEKFCSGISGKSVQKELSLPNRKTVVLEDRWKRKLDEFIPEDSIVVPNFSESLSDRSNHELSGKIRLLVLSRDSPGKNHDFAIEVMRALHGSGDSASMSMTGISDTDSDRYGELDIDFLGWVEEERKSELISKADFLISPSEFEGSSMSVIESMRSGLPCFVSPASGETLGIPEMVISSRDPGEWAEEILRWNNKEMYDNAVLMVRSQSERFAPEISRGILEGIYNDLLNLNHSN
jgi:glycosyltransferase involved in cell wall biosynthesis